MGGLCSLMRLGAQSECCVLWVVWVVRPMRLYSENGKGLLGLHIRVVRVHLKNGEKVGKHGIEC